MNKRQIAIKPTFMNELAAFPHDRVHLLWEKITQLVSDPFPDGKVKKKLHAGDGIYRLRVGDHRVFYRFGDDWVSLLGVRRRQEDTYRQISNETDAPELPDDIDDNLDALLAAPTRRVFDFSRAAQQSTLPVAITDEWLSQHRIPESTHTLLKLCTTEDALLEAAVPEDVLKRVLDAMWPPGILEVAHQPDLIVPSADALVHYREGDLLTFLLRLDADQLRLTRWAMRGPTLVRGGAGTGKSTVALYRVREVLNGRGGHTNETVLFTTYTNALLRATTQLLEQLLSPDQMRRVRVATCDQLVREIVASTRKVTGIESDSDSLRRLNTLRASFAPSAPTQFEAAVRKRQLDRISTQYLLDEFHWIVEGRGFTTLDEYVATPRPGRGIAFGARLRETVWELYEHFAASGGDRFASLRNEALQIVRLGRWKGHFDHVFVDEAQDLSPVSLALLAECARSAEGVFFAADTKQSLYSRNYSWSSAHERLNFKGRTALLRRNYRSTGQIDRAAFSVLRAGEGELLEVSENMHEGPLPVLLVGATEQHEAEWVATFIRQMARHLHLRTSAAAVLVPSNAIGEAFAAQLRERGHAATFFAGRDLEIRSDVVKVITLHSAKGLEFPIVAMAGFAPGTYPTRADFDDDDAYEERLLQERRLLYVGMTRAMRGLMVVVRDDCEHDALVTLNREQWHVQEAR